MSIWLTLLSLLTKTGPMTINCWNSWSSSRSRCINRLRYLATSAIVIYQALGPITSARWKTRLIKCSQVWTSHCSRTHLEIKTFVLLSQTWMIDRHKRTRFYRVMIDTTSLWTHQILAHQNSSNSIMITFKIKQWITTLILGEAWRHPI